MLSWIFIKILSKNDCMKLLVNTLFLFTFILIASSCKDDEVPNLKPDPEGDCFTAMIDGEAYESDNVSAIYTEGSPSNEITIDATSSTGTMSKFQLNIISPRSHVFQLDPSLPIQEATVLYFPDGGASQNFAATSGAITVSTFDATEKRIAGTFQFNIVSVDEEISITTGVFDVKW